MELNTKQIKQLKSLGHQLSPIVTVGQHGMKESINTELAIALDFHQLVKIKVGLGDREQRNELIDTLTAHHGAALIQRIGNIALLYKRNSEKPSVLTS